MNILRRVFAFYVNSSIHVSMSAIALTAITVLQYKLTVPLELWAFIFLGTIVGYNFIKFIEPVDFHTIISVRTLRVIFTFSLSCFLVLCFFAFQLSWQTLLVASFLGFLTVWYAVPMITSKNLRNQAGLKAFVVALVWAGVTVILPMISVGRGLDGGVWFTFFERVLIVLVLMIPFEIRDVSIDSYHLQTLPQRLGVRNTKFLGKAILILLLGVELFKGFYREGYLIAFIIFVLLLGWSLFASKVKQKTYFSSFWVEGLPLLWLLSFIVIRELLFF